MSTGTKTNKNLETEKISNRIRQRRKGTETRRNLDKKGTRSNSDTERHSKVHGINDRGTLEARIRNVDKAERERKNTQVRRRAETMRETRKETVINHRQKRNGDTKERRVTNTEWKEARQRETETK